MTAQGFTFEAKDVILSLYKTRVVHTSGHFTYNAAVERAPE